MIRHRNSRQRGMVLVTTLLLLIVVTILAVGMFRSFGLDEKIAGNTREKQRALNAAETAEQYAEYWLVNATNTGPVTCTGLVTASTSNYIGQVCSNVLTTSVPNVAQVPWALTSAPGTPVGVSYTPSAPAVMNVTGVSGGAGNYYAAPVYYISYLGVSSSGLQTFYQIDAVGYGGSPDTAAVVESTYVLTQTNKCLSCSE
jgi:type IV pilus assembly protein PilX